MESLTLKFYDAAYNIWNTLIEIAMTLFTTSPTSANGNVYTIAKTTFDAIADISIPVAIVFFILAIIKDVLATPPEQQARKFIQSTLKFAVLVGLLVNLWLVMGYIMQIADGITDKIGISGNYQLLMTEEFKNAITDFYAQEPATQPSGLGTEYIKTLVQNIKEWVVLFIKGLVFTIAGFMVMIMTIAAGISIISAAFQRIIKPLVILPFSTITVAFAAGSNEAEQVTRQYLKTFFGLCISGAFMVIAVKLGAALIDGGLIAFNTSTMDAEDKMLYLTIQNAITPTVIAGLVKSADSTIARFF